MEIRSSTERSNCGNGGAVGSADEKLHIYICNKRFVDCAKTTSAYRQRGA